ncbi:MAG TPA: hypothetical protein VFY85_08415 [Gemmatimonadaceae bacterium]|nr:hypothetical protein [Gemmatimonadaceae bacterium]
MRVTMNRLAQATRIAAIAAVLVSSTATIGAAQQASGSRWQGWLGCWTAAGPDALVPSNAPVVCITPTSSADVVNVATVQDGKVLATKTIDANGAAQPIEARDCTGTQSAEWSADARRVYLKATASCAGTTRTTSGILAMSPTGEWLDVQGIAAGEGENVRVARYRDAGLPEKLPADIRSALEGRNASVQGARVAAGANVGTAAVIEASKKATPAVVEAWLLERGQRFALDAKTLMQLADAGVPARVTDAMVAVSNPRQFAVAHEAPATQYNRPDDEVTGRRIPVFLAPPPYDPFSWGYSPYGYGYGYPYGYGYNGYGYGGYYGYPYYGSPVIVVPGGNVPGSNGGRMVRGQGYQPGVGASSTGRTAKPRNEPSPADTRSSGSWSSPSSQGSSSAGSSQPASTTRTAKPRP